MDSRPQIWVVGLWLLGAAGCPADDGRGDAVWVPPGIGDESGGEGTTDTGTTTRSAGLGSTGEDESTSEEGSTGGETGAAPVDVCEGLMDEPLIPPVTCDGPGGNTSTELAPNDLYSTSWFGCYRQDNGTIYHDPYDNCEFACGNQGLCPPEEDGPTCEANLRWFAADADRFGCGGRIRVTNCENGSSVVLVTLDRGPNCNSVEKACDAPVLDMSHDAMVHLFDGGIYGGCDHRAVVVEEVDPDTPLGPI